MKQMFAWNDFFDSGTPETIKQQTTRQTPSNASVYVFLCLFNRCTSTDYGGALSCSSSVEYLLIESSAFFSCTTTRDRAGAIYISNSNCQSVLHKVCGYDCYSTSSTSWGQFSFTIIKSGDTSKNFINYSSISRCGRGDLDSTEMLTLCNGLVCCPSINSSNNKCARYSGIYTNSAHCLFSHSSFVDNSATGHTCIRINKAGVNHEIKYCNILRNTQVSSSGGTLYINGNAMIKDSCILDNVATYIFSISSYTVTLSNCTLDKTTTNNNGYLTIQNTVTKSFIHALNHMSTAFCIAEYDSAGNLTPIIEQPTSSKKIICYYSFKNFYYQPHLRDLVSLLWVFVFNILLPNPSISL